MTEVVVQLCEQLKREAQAIIDHAKSTEAVIKSGEEGSIETMKMFEDLSADSVGHCQKLVIALSNHFFQTKQEEAKT